MIDENGNICLLIKFTSYYDYEKEMWLPSMMNLPGGIFGDRKCHWSLVEDTNEFNTADKEQKKGRISEMGKGIIIY